MPLVRAGRPQPGRAWPRPRGRPPAGPARPGGWSRRRARPRRGRAGRGSPRRAGRAARRRASAACRGRPAGAARCRSRPRAGAGGGRSSAGRSASWRPPPRRCRCGAARRALRGGVHRSCRSIMRQRIYWTDRWCTVEGRRHARLRRDRRRRGDRRARARHHPAGRTPAPRPGTSAPRCSSSTSTCCRPARSRCAAGCTSPPGSPTSSGRSGLVTCSTGNHAQSVAYAARLAGCHATVVMPACAPQVKRDAVAALGAYGRQPRRQPRRGRGARARSLAGAAAPARRRTSTPRTRGSSSVTRPPTSSCSGRRPTSTPSSSRSAAAPAPSAPAWCGTPSRRRCRVIGVQSAAAPAAWRSWRSGAIETAPATTRASGLATSNGYPATLAVPARRPPGLRAGLRRRHRPRRPAARRRTRTPWPRAPELLRWPACSRPTPGRAGSR